VVGIFDNAFAEHALGDVPMETTRAMLAIKTTDVPADPVGKSCVVRSVTYAVTGTEPDGTYTGFTRLLLER
jgi:hypothetical protein